MEEKDSRLIVTERLILRTYQVTDVKSCFQHFGQDTELGRFLPMYPVSDQKAMEDMVHNYVKASEEGAFIWVIEKKNHECIGNVTVDVPYSQLGVGEIGYLLGVRYWHQGYASEAVSAVVSYMFQEAHLHLIEAKYNEQNKDSEKLLQRLGFREEARLRERRIDLQTGERNAMVICSITEDEMGRVRT